MERRCVVLWVMVSMKKRAQLNVYNLAKMRLQPPHQFKWLRFDPNNDCNLHCVYCHNPRSKELIDLSEFSAFLEENVLSLDNFQLGCIMEPTLDSRLTDFMLLVAASKAKPSGQFVLQTNGILLHRHDLEKMRAAGLTHISVSIDSADPATLKDLRGGTSLDKIRSNILLARKTLPEVKIGFMTTVTSLNIGQMQDLVAFGLDIGVSNFYLREMFHFQDSDIVDHARMLELKLAKGAFGRMERSLSAAFEGRANLGFWDESMLKINRNRVKTDSLR